MQSPQMGESEPGSVSGSASWRKVIRNSSANWFLLFQMQAGRAQLVIETQGCVYLASSKTNYHFNSN